MGNAFITEEAHPTYSLSNSKSPIYSFENDFRDQCERKRIEGDQSPVVPLNLGPPQIVKDIPYEETNDPETFYNTNNTHYVRRYVRSEAQKKNYSERYNQRELLRQEFENGTYRYQDYVSPVAEKTGDDFRQQDLSARYVSFTAPRKVYSYNNTAPVTPLLRPDIRKVPVVFRWRGKGRDVYLHAPFIPTIDHKIRMIPSEDDMYAILLVPKAGVYNYRFIVDNIWTYAPEQPKIKQYGLNMYVNQINMNDYFPFEMECQAIANKKTQLIEYRFRQEPVIPLVSSFIHEPPSLHFLQQEISLNHPFENGRLPPPSFVNIDHLYTRPNETGVNLLATIIRYDKKVTNVFYVSYLP
ncbi:hypothetical protein WA158_000455 [Blastocystis sp. Blastoise]